jgi:hypothetical protein
MTVRPTHVDPAIISYLTPDRADLIFQSLHLTSRFRCPACGNAGDSQQEPTRAVLYHRIAAAGGFSGPTSDIYRPDEPTLVRWWLVRTHQQCRLAPLLDWTRLPDWATPPASPAASAADALDPALQWSASVTPTGLPVLVWRQAVPVVQVVRTESRSGIGTEHLVDVTAETMQARGGRPLTRQDLLLDNVSGLDPLGDWYAQLHPEGRLTAWMPGSSLQRITAHTGGTDPETLRTPLCTLDGLPTDWILAAAAQRRILLVLNAPPVHDNSTGQPGTPDVLGPPIGGIVTTGLLDDSQRPTTGGHQTQARPHRTPPPIDVDAVWQAALERGAHLVGDYRTEFPGRWLHTTVDPSYMIALVLVAIAREQNTPPEQTPLAAVAAKLADAAGDLPAWLSMMLQPTTIAGHLEQTHQHLSILDEPRSLFGDLRHQARAAVDRQRLIDAGSLRVGDRVRWLRPGSGSTAPTAAITGVSILTWPHPNHRSRAITHFDIDVDTDLPNRSPGRTAPHISEIYNLLLADTDDPRALPHAAYSAAVTLWCHSPDTHNPPRPHQTRATVRAQLPHYPAPVQHLLHTVLDAGDTVFTAALVDGIEHLRALAHGHPIPGDPVTHY